MGELEVLDQIADQIILWLSNEMLLRLLLACVCGAIIGGERTKRLKEAGVRTHVLVCFTAALLMLVSKYGFGDPHGENGDSRIASQVVNGISFLCAGVIFKNGSVIKGLTTAAGIWATAAVGLALGSGMYGIGIISTAIIMLLQITMHHFLFRRDTLIFQKVIITVASSKDFEEKLKWFIEKLDGGMEYSQVSMKQSGVTTYNIKVWMKKDIEYKEEWQVFMNANPEICKIDYALLV